MTGSITSVWLENRRGASTVGIDEVTPRLSWLSSASARPDHVDLEIAAVRGAEVVRIPVTSSRLLEWPTAPLHSRDHVTLRLREVLGEQLGEWSEPLIVEAGLLQRSDWLVPFVSPSLGADTTRLRPGYLLRAEWDLAALGLVATDIEHARIYSTAHGMYELEVNGRRLGDELLSPGWTSYEHRLRYQTYDVTDVITEDRNVIGAWLADGWYRGRIGFDGGVWDTYGADVALLLQLELRLRDGRLVRVPLEDRWVRARSPIVESGLYEGEHFDARLTADRWSTAGFDDAGWAPAEILPLRTFPATLEAPTGPPVRVIETLRPVSVAELPGGRIRLDFGQNVAGRLRIRPHGASGHAIRLHHAEVLEDGLLGTRPLRTAIAIDTYVCRGTDDEEWSPRFTIHGFRYAELENWPGGVDTVDVEALVIHTDMERTGWFESSHARLNQLHSNIVWSMRDNFVDLPTDCPQRDERMGWTGDIQVFAPTALTLYGAHGTLTGWLKDLAHEQADHGHVPNFVPWVECGFPNFPTAAWGDAAVIVPWEIYRHDGDTRVLEEQYPSMKAWVDLVDSLTRGTGLWNQGFQLGDWLDPAAPPDDPGDSKTDRYLVATAYHVRTARLLAAAAEILDRAADARHYEALAERSTAAFRAEYLAADGHVICDTPAAIALALVFELLDDEQIRVNGERLLDLVAQSGYRITTGFVGTPIICDALVIAGGLDSAYRLLLQDQLPSWLYPVSMGATTVWERWDSMLPDGSINPGGMTSFNHYALGAVADFMHRVVGGLSSMEPGGGRLRFAPQPGGGLTRARVAHLGPLGLASSSWSRDGRSFDLEIEVPRCATAVVAMPGVAEEVTVGSGMHRFTCEFRSPEEDAIRTRAPA